MKRIIILVALFTCALASAQTTSEEYLAKYERQVRAVGPAGVGVETILDRWAEAFPDSKAMLEGKHFYYLAKNRRTEIVAKPLPRFLGKAPLMSLKDSLGHDVNYFEEDFFDDECFSQCASTIDKAIELYPNDLGLRIDLLNALLAYEKECPDMVTMEIRKLIDLNYFDKVKWVLDGEVLDEDTFKSVIQEYCVAFYNIASPDSYESFKSVSEKMLSMDSKDTMFLANLGTYWLIAKKNDKAALKYYNKVLKINPKDYAAAKNCVLLARKSKNDKLEKKYLPVLIESTPDEGERKSCTARLEALSK